MLPAPEVFAAKEGSRLIPCNDATERPVLFKGTFRLMREDDSKRPSSRSTKRWK